MQGVRERPLRHNPAGSRRGLLPRILAVRKRVHPGQGEEGTEGEEGPPRRAVAVFSGTAADAMFPGKRPEGPIGHRNHLDMFGAGGRD